MNTLNQLVFLLLVVDSMRFSITTPNCISKQQQSELPYCCQTEPLIPEHVATKCKEREANHNPGTELFEVCYQQCIYEELEAVDGLEIRVDRLYVLAERFPADYRHAVHLAVDECNKRLRKTRHMFEQMNAQCSLFGYAVDRCVRLLIYENCPTARWSAGVACTKSRQGAPFC
uniref:Uncharacterized protein n=1 Tax=Anopheles quadriannulatus TaxID=34691 RepID=A0A904A4Q9_ANOQN